MKYLYGFIASLCFIGIQGCSTPEEDRARQQRYAEQQRNAAEYERQSLQSTCRGYGYNIGSDSMARCMQQEKDKKDAIARKDYCYSEASKSSGRCKLGCYALSANQVPACSSNCEQNHNVAKAACEGVYIQPSQQSQPIIIQQQEPIVYPGIPSGANIRPSTMNPFGR